VLAGLASEAATEVMDVHLVALPGEDAERSAAFQRLVAEDRADGFVILSFLSLTPEDMRPLEEAGMPYVLVNRHFEHLTVPPAQLANCVTLDWLYATEDAGRRLDALGHRRMVLLLPESDRSTVWDHEQGWHLGVSAAGLAEDGAPVWHFAQSELTARIGQLIDQIRAAPDAAPTAVVCFNDATAFAVLRAAAAGGVRVPEQLSVIGFDNRIGEYTTPPLCSYDGHLLDVGKEAARLMGAVLRREQPERPIDVDGVSFPETVYGWGAGDVTRLVRAEPSSPPGTLKTRQ